MRVLALVLPNGNYLANIQFQVIQLCNKYSCYCFVESCAIHVDGSSNWKYKPGNSFINEVFFFCTAEGDRQSCWTGTQINTESKHRWYTISFIFPFPYSLICRQEGCNMKVKSWVLKQNYLCSFFKLQEEITKSWLSSKIHIKIFIMYVTLKQPKL